MNDAPQGVIYFTFGSVVSMSTLPENVQIAFWEALASVPQKVLWKYEGEMEDKPKNVMTRKWFPQRDILCTRSDIIKPYSWHNVLTFKLYYLWFINFKTLRKLSLLFSAPQCETFHQSWRYMRSVRSCGRRCSCNRISCFLRPTEKYWQFGWRWDDDLHGDLLSVTKETFLNAVLEIVKNDRWTI